MCDSCRQCNTGIWELTLATFVVFASGLLLFVAFSVFMQHTGSRAVSAMALLVSACCAVLCFESCHRRSPAIGIALSLLVAGVTASQVSHRLAGAPLYAPFGVLSVVGGTCSAMATCLVVYFLWRLWDRVHKEQETKPQAEPPGQHREGP